MEFISIASSSSGNCYLLKSGGSSHLLIDCGISIKRIRGKLWGRHVSIGGLAACLVDHSHGDHSKAVLDLLKSGVDVYLLQETAEALHAERHHRTHIIKHGSQESVEGWTVLPFELHHDVPAAGFLIAAPDGEKLLFVPDTAYLTNRFQGVEIIAVECNYVADILSDNIQRGALPQVVGHRVRRSHMSLDTVLGFLKANDLSQCREIHLLHLSDGNSNEETMRRRVQEATGVPCFVCEA